MFSEQQVEQSGVESGDKYGSFNTIALQVSQPASPAEPARHTDTGARNL